MAHLQMNGYFTFKGERNLLCFRITSTCKLLWPQSSCGWEKIFKWFFQPQTDHHYRNRTICKFKELFVKIGQLSGMWTIKPLLPFPMVTIKQFFLRSKTNLKFLLVEEVDTFRCNADLWHFWHRFQYRGTLKSYLWPTMCIVSILTRRIFSASCICGHWRCATRQHCSCYVVTTSADISQNTLPSSKNVGSFH